MKRELEKSDPSNTNAGGKAKDTKDNGKPLKGKKVSREINGVHGDENDISNPKTELGGIREDQPGRDSRGDRNAI